MEWLNYYNKLVDEYQKIEGELNGLDLVLDADHNLHSEMKQQLDAFLEWKGSISSALSFIRSLSGEPTLEQLRGIHDALSEDKLGRFAIWAAALLHARCSVTRWIRSAMNWNAI